MEEQKDYDYLIVGAGLAGLHTALRLSNKYPSKSICICEAYSYKGGRVVTHFPKRFPGVQWENGAGRIHSSHSMVLEYIHKYNLTTIPIDDKVTWISSDGHVTRNEKKDIWPGLASFLIESLQTLPPKQLQLYTVFQILEQLIGKTRAHRLLAHFPYRAETFLLRADLALQSFQKEMGTNQGYVVVKEGLSSLITHMVSELEEKGVEILLGHRLLSVNTHDAYFQVTEEGCKKYKTISAKKIILALHSSALQKINPFSRHPILKKLLMAPLLRTYAIFPVVGGKTWFSDIGKVVTNSPIRYFIPINPAKGIVMISYTDFKDSTPWTSLLHEKGEYALERGILKEIRKLFPEKKIPNPIFFKAHEWSDGCTYWLPGLYDPHEYSEKMMKPFPTRFPNLYCCGESFSVGLQAWMEGALQNAEQLVEKYL